MSRRLYQETALKEFISAKNRFWALLWERQSGKSTTLADIALYEMLRHENRTVIYGSASLLLSQEITIKAAIRANQSIRQMIENDAAALKQFADTAQAAIDAQNPKPASVDSFYEMCAWLNQLAKAGNPVFRQDVIMDETGIWVPPETSDPWPDIPQPEADAEAPVEFKTFDASTGKEIIGGEGANAKRISAASFAELFSQQRLEFRVYHDHTSYSRTKVIAPNIATARSWSGTVLLDEVAFIRNSRELINALLPVISADKQFKLILSTTPPEFDDTHYFI